MKKINLKQLRRNFKISHYYWRYRFLLICLIAVTILTTLGCRYSFPLTTNWQLVIALLSFGGALAGGFAAVYFFWRDRLTRNQCAAKIDREQQAHNQLEAYLTVPKEHPLYAALEHQVLTAYADWQVGFQKICNYVLVLGLLTGLWWSTYELQAAWARIQLAYLQQSEQKRNQAAVPPDEQKAAELYAELALTAPIAELQAKPLDEIEWTGVGNSPHGFRQIRLVISVNAEEKLRLAPELLPTMAGEIQFGGFLALDALAVAPFDLVSYYLAGQAEVDGKIQTILSLPQFIEVQPFRKDSIKLSEMSGADSALKSVFETQILLTGLLSGQIELNKKLFAAKILARRNTGATTSQLQQILDELRQGQQTASQELEKFLQNPLSRFLPLEILTHLESALQQIKVAATALEEAKK